MNLKRIRARIEYAWDGFPMILKILAIPFLLCIGAVGFIMFCLVAPFVILFVLVSSLPYVTVKLFANAEQLPPWYVRYVRFWWKAT